MVAILSLPRCVKMLLWLLSKPKNITKCSIWNRCHINSQRTRDAIITPLLHQNDVATSFWRYNDVVIASCARWVAMRPPEGDPVLTDGWRLRWRHAARRPDWGIPSRSTTTTTQDVWKQEYERSIPLFLGWTVPRKYDMSKVTNLD